MLNGIRDLLIKHFMRNIRTYFFLFLAFVAGVSAGAFTVNALSTLQSEELNNYFIGFLKLFNVQRMDSSELIKIAVWENIRIILVLWVLGVTIIGIPFIYLIIGIKGFITGFCSGFIIKVLGLKGIGFLILTLVPKELIIVPCLIALGVSGINFSLDIIKSKSIKSISKENLKTGFLAYCFVTLIFSGMIFAGAFFEAYISPVFVRMISSIIAS